MPERAPSTVKVFFVVLAIILNIAGAFVLKLFTGTEKTIIITLLYLFLIAFIYIARSISWLMIGKWYQLSFIYPVISVNYIVAFLIGLLYFNEEFSALKLSGSLVITIGVILISLSPNKHEKEKM